MAEDAGAKVVETEAAALNRISSVRDHSQQQRPNMAVTTEDAKTALDALGKRQHPQESLNDPFADLEKWASSTAAAATVEDAAATADDGGSAALTPGHSEKGAQTLKKKRPKRKVPRKPESEGRSRTKPDEATNAASVQPLEGGSASREPRGESALRKSARRRRPKPTEDAAAVPATQVTGATADQGEVKHRKMRKKKPVQAATVAVDGANENLPPASENQRKRRKKRLAVPDAPPSQMLASPTSDNQENNDNVNLHLSKEEKRQKSKEGLQKLKAALMEQLAKKEAQEAAEAPQKLASIPENDQPIKEATMEDIREVFGLDNTVDVAKARQNQVDSNNSSQPHHDGNSFSTINLDDLPKPSKQVRDAPVDLLSETIPPEQRPLEMDSLLRPYRTNKGDINGVGAAPIQDPEELVERYHASEKLRQQRARRRRLLIIGVGFLLAVGIVALVVTFVVGWDDEENVPANMVVSGQLYLPDSALVEGTEAALAQPLSPQYRAYNWLGQDPRRDEYPEWQLIQRFAVATIVFALRKSDQATDPIWLHYDRSECDWGASDDATPILCDSDGLVSKLDLAEISGVQDDFVTSIPIEITLLDRLEGLGIARNGVFVTWSELLPLEMQRIASTFRILNVGQNEIHDQLRPSSLLFRLSNLQELDASANLLTGTIPSEISMLKELARLDLSFNTLSGSMPNFGALQKLEYLSLAGNKLSKKIPTSVGSLVKLKWLDLSESALTGRLPSQLGQSPSLASLVLCKTMISGRIPSEIFSTGRTLKNLDLSENALEGQIPSEVGLLSTLQRLSLSLTALSGSLPTELGGLKSAEEVIVSNTLLVGSLPTQLAFMTSLKRLELAGSSHSGAICSEIGLLGKALLHLDLSKNAFNDRLPSEIGALSKLTHLDASFNSITGAIPMDLELLSSAQIIDLSRNYMTGQIPSFQDALSLRVLRLGGNYYTGSTLPTQLGLLTQLIELDLSDTAIDGSIPSEWGRLTNLQVLKLGNNITGTLPAGLCRSQLTTLSVNCDKIKCGDCSCECQV